jgi:WD40 repeat protein
MGFSPGSVAHSVAYAPNDQFIVTGHQSGHLKVWDLRSGKVEKSMNANSSTSAVYSTNFIMNSDHYVVCTNADNTLTKLDLRQLSVKSTMENN